MEPRLVRRRAVLEIKSRRQHFLIVVLGFVESLFKGGDSSLRLFGFTEGNGQIERKLRDIVETLPRFREDLDRAFASLSGR